MSVVVDKYKVDDLEAAKDPETDVRATQTVRFAMGGAEWEIDLKDENADKLHKKLEPYMKAGRRIRGAGPRSRPVSARRRSGEIRDWAKERGIAVSERGRIPGAVIEQYEAAVGG